MLITTGKISADKIAAESITSSRMTYVNCDTYYKPKSVWTCEYCGKVNSKDKLICLGCQGSRLED